MIEQPFFTRGCLWCWMATPLRLKGPEARSSRPLIDFTRGAARCGKEVLLAGLTPMTLPSRLVLTKGSHADCWIRTPMGAREITSGCLRHHRNQPVIGAPR
jgi:hypothetical protein